MIQIDTSGLSAWRRTKPRPLDVTRAVKRALKGAPKQWHESMGYLGELRDDAPEWLACLEALDTLRTFEEKHGDAAQWHAMGDDEICQLAEKLAGEAQELDAAEVADGADLLRRLDTMRMLVRMAGVEEPRALSACTAGDGSIARVKDARWWRRALRVHVARVVEAGAIKLGIVNRRQGGYASHSAVTRRAQQVARNAAQLEKSLYRNEAGQVFTLAELAALSTANPVIRGGELMTRIRGAEEYADAAGHVGLFLTLTVPSHMHAVTVGSGGRARPNPRYDGKSTPRDSQLWLRKYWAQLRAYCARWGITMYGLRVAEPHHDATPHWHALLWVENDSKALDLEEAIWNFWLRDHGRDKGAAKNRVNVKRMTSGGAAGYVAKYIAKSVGHHALADHIDHAQGQLFDIESGDVPGYRRVDAWASTWGIRQFQSIGMPSVSVWREMRRVTHDQAEAARMTWKDSGAWAAWTACGARWGEIEGKADWCRYMVAMGGHARSRKDWALRVARRAVPEGEVNQYGEAITQGRAVGVECTNGRWLISRRIAWKRVADAQRQEKAERAALAAPWTGFNNCTARLTGRLRSALLGLKEGANHEGCASGSLGVWVDEYVPRPQKEKTC